MKVKFEGKVCGVCGDKALGCNFNAITCESCKAFFRRNALIQKDFKCPFSEHCTITPVTRRFCQKCRLDKCFAIGMCKNLIMSAEDKEMKRKKILENRTRKRMGLGAFKKGFKKVKKDLNVTDEISIQTSEEQDDDEVSLQAPTVSPSQNNHNVSSVVTDEIQLISPNDTQIVSSSDEVSMIRSILNNTPQKNQNFHQIERNSESNIHPNIQTEENVITETNNDNSIYNIRNISSSNDDLSDITKDEIDDVENSSSEANSLETILCEAIKLEYQTFSPVNHSNSKELNDAERAKLNELIVANKVLSAPFDEDIENSLLGQLRDPHGKLEADPALLDVINLTAIAVRRLIRMVKKINAFKSMCQEDQVCLLKGGAIEIMILRSAMNYDSKNKSWQIPKKQQSINLNVEILKQAKNNAYAEHEKFIKTFDPRWRSDENIILIMCAIALFTPDRPRVVHQEVIKLEQNSYYYLLRRYLECTYPGCEAKSTFLKLMQKISKLHLLNEELINIYLDVNPSQVEPLLIELFDLKP
ncbi:nuclear hormone receptor HR96 [Coccinella septempunctata]|uniref:nuclear hormone receptor HR96 n=1 Tax=Coccinella septempunctata TaxID=41139 RepID=UPI001D05F48B|nr:nuclear hormone receptor HR96 [Coccinella septempunctata]